MICISKTSVIIVAAGKGSRMGMGYNKQYIILGNKPIVAHTINVFENSNLIDEIILVVGKDEVELAREDIVKKYGFNKVYKVIEGGEERFNSVYNGLKAVDINCDIVLVHDGARPFITENIIKKGIVSVMKYKAVVTAVPVKDTIKIVNKSNEVEKTLSRETLCSVQTPQFFKYELIINAYKKLQGNNINFTDDAMLMEKLGYSVKIINGNYENIKITTPEDLILGEGILRRRQEEN